MGYHIGIGDAVIDDSGDELMFDVRCIDLSNAPTFNGHFESYNECSISYLALENFAKEANLYTLFFGDNEQGDILGDYHREKGIAISHVNNGAVKLKKEDLYAIREALDIRFDAELDDWVMRLLVWLEFWMDHALRNCVIPTIIFS